MLSADETNKIEFRGQYANIRCLPLLQLLSCSLYGCLLSSCCSLAGIHHPALPCYRCSVARSASQHLQRRPSGLIQIDFHDGESFSFNPLVTTVQHIILGTQYIDHSGNLHVRSSLSGLSSRIKFKEPVIGPPQHKVNSWQTASLSNLLCGLVMARFCSKNSAACKKDR